MTATMRFHPLVSVGLPPWGWIFRACDVNIGFSRVAVSIGASVARILVVPWELLRLSLFE